MTLRSMINSAALRTWSKKVVEYNRVAIPSTYFFINDMPHF